MFVHDSQQTLSGYTSDTTATGPTYDYVCPGYGDAPAYGKETVAAKYFHRTQQRWC